MFQIKNRCPRNGITSVYYKHVFGETIIKLSWSSLGIKRELVAHGWFHHVLILIQEKYSAILSFTAERSRCFEFMEIIIWTRCTSTGGHSNSAWIWTNASHSPVLRPRLNILPCPIFPPGWCLNNCQVGNYKALVHQICSTWPCFALSFIMYILISLV